MRGELSIMQNEKSVLESKLAAYEDVVEEVSTLKATIACFELENIGPVDKIAMLEHVVQKLKGDLSDSSLRNMGLQASVVKLENQLNKVNVDVSRVLSHRITKLVDKLIVESSFFEANCDLQTTCVDFSRRAGLGYCMHWWVILVMVVR